METSRPVYFIPPSRPDEASTQTLREHHAATPKEATGRSSIHVRPQKTSGRCAIRASIRRDGETTEGGHSVFGLTGISSLDSRQPPTEQEVDRRAGLKSTGECAKTRATMQSQGGSGNGRWAWARGITALTSAVVLLGACSADTPHPAGIGMLSGQVVVSGPLRGAAVSVDQIDYGAKTSVAVAAHVGDATTDEDGHFELPDIGSFNGLLLITAKGGAYTDLAAGLPIQLDPGAGLETIVDIDLLGKNDDVLVSPVGHLIAARTRGEMAKLGDVVMAEADAASHLSRHFGNVPSWSRMTLASLETMATTTSPTEPLRGALVQAALSYLASDIAGAAHASPQEVNVLLLTKQLAADVAVDGFDGNDKNDASFGSGLQVGACAPLPNCPAPAGDLCAQEGCRTKCDLYAGTVRSFFAGELTRVINDKKINMTGLMTDRKSVV